MHALILTSIEYTEKIQFPKVMGGLNTGVIIYMQFMLSLKVG